MLYFVRHGQSVANAQGVIAGQFDSPLTETGLEQARLAAEASVSLGITHIAASPLVRARQTAEAIAWRLRLVANLDHRLMERATGAATGKPKGYLLQHKSHEAIEGLESLDRLHARTLDTLRTLPHSTQTVLVVAHDGVGRMLKLIIEKRPLETYYEETGPPNAEIIRLA